MSSTSTQTVAHNSAEGREHTIQRASQIIATVIVLVTIGAAPWCFGGVPTTAQLGLHLSMFIALAAWLVSTVVGRQTPWSPPLATLLVAAGLLLGGMQLIPFGEYGPLGTWTGSGQVRAELQAAGGTGEARSDTSAKPLSLYAAATRRELTLLILALAMFLAGARFFAQTQPFLWLCGLCATNGAAISLFGFAQRLSWNGKIYWTEQAPAGASTFGPFVYHNQAASYLTLCLAANLIWFLYLVRNTSAEKARGFGKYGGHKYRNQPWSQIILYRLQDMIAKLDGRRLTVLLMLVCNLAGLLGTLSRGAFLATCAGGMIAGLAVLLVHRKYSQFWLYGAGMLISLSLLSWVGMLDTVTERLNTLTDADTLFASQSRLDHWSVDIRAAAKHWGVGSGLGTYRFVYGAYQDQLMESWWGHAHNQYHEALIDGGIVALALVLGAIACVFHQCWRLLHSRRSFSRIIGGVGLLIIASQALHSVGEFHLYLPANTLLMAILCGAIVGRYTSNAAESPVKQRWTSHMTIGMVGLLLIGITWSHRELRGVNAIEAVTKSLPWGTDQRSIPLDDLNRTIGQLEASLARRPDDAEGQDTLAQLYILRYRHVALAQFDRERKSPEETAAEQTDQWGWTSPLVLHHRAHKLATTENTDGLLQLRAQPVVVDNLRPAVEHLLLARAACPLLPFVHLRLAELSFVADSPDSDADHLQRARLVAPSDVDIRYQAGRIEFSASRFEQAYQDWQVSLALSRKYEHDILRYSRATLSVEQLIEKLLPQSPERLVRLIASEYRDPSQEQDRAKLLVHASRLAEESTLEPAMRHYLAARIAHLRGDFAQAIESYQLACRADPQKHEWRYALAQLLRRENDLPKARFHVRICVTQQPRNKKFRKLLRDIEAQQRRKR